MVLGSVFDWFGSSIPNKLADDGRKARNSTMEIAGSRPDMKEKTVAEEVEVDSELARPPYIHVCLHSKPPIRRTSLIDRRRQFWQAE